ncbi:MAG: iron-containing alcohol dehydrogenase [Blautia massiliensis (ex Durand et al. 2017)]|uniref:iron-containing alcohol dehydrogenase n=1 Tax=Blautia massiliensis (ex Durand et al. 2017) TaxID=1737424 RepID=UPI0039934A4D
MTDAGIRSLGLTERLEQTLKRNCISYHIYDKTVANPTTVNVDEALHMYLDNDCQAIIGFAEVPVWTVQKPQQPALPSHTSLLLR